MHFHYSGTRNRNHHILLIMTGNAHKESCHKLSLTLGEGEGIDPQLKLMIATKWLLLFQLQK